MTAPRRRGPSAPLAPHPGSPGVQEPDRYEDPEREVVPQAKRHVRPEDPALEGQGYHRSQSDRSAPAWAFGNRAETESESDERGDERERRNPRGRVLDAGADVGVAVRVFVAGEASSLGDRMG